MTSTSDAGDATPGDGVCDDGAGNCTLRAAIQEANANAGADTIHFAIGTGPQTIVLDEDPLPSVEEAVTIDGTTQPGYSGTPLIEVDGFGVNASAIGIALGGSGGSTLRGLMINRFNAAGAAIGSSGNIIEQCYFGTDATRTQNRGNGTSLNDGVYLLNSAISTASNNIIRNNVIAFSGRHGVAVYEHDNNTYPSFTALTPDQTVVVPSIDFRDDCGSFQHASGPVILDTLGRAFNENIGMRLTATLSVSMSGTYTFTFTQLDDSGRLVIDSVEQLSSNGSGASVDVALSAGDHAFELDFIERGGAATLLFNVSGPATATFSHAGNPGLLAELFQLRFAPAEGNTISQNSIFNNGAQGIALSCCCRDTNDAGDVDVGPNTFLNYPVFTNAVLNPNGTFTLDGTAPPNAIVEIFGSTNDTSPPGQGYGEGKFYAGTTTADGSGNFSTTLTVPWEYYAVTATATDAAGNTSEFSQNFVIHPRQVTVTNTNDSGPGSFRSAIEEANGDGVATAILFDSLLAGSSILLLTSLPPLSEDTTAIHGDINNDCIPDIEIHGNGPATTGLIVFSSGNVIGGLAMNRFSNEAVLIEGALAQGNHVVCNYIGFGLDGMTTHTIGAHGVIVRNGADTNFIGRPGRRNVIGGLAINGVWIENAPGNTVAENAIGLDATGTAVPTPVGVHLTGATATTIDGNRIVAVNAGIDVSGGNDIPIVANTIGWPAGSTPTGDGIFVHDNAMQVSIGGPASTLGNRIENNGGAGVRVAGSDGVRIRWNAISGNGGLGIDLDGDGVTPNDTNGDSDSGANDNFNFPIITHARSNGSVTHVEGFLDTWIGNHDIEIYASSERDPSGYGEGATRLFGATIPTGAFSFDMPSVPVGSFVTAIAMDAAGNTSEFSLAKEVLGAPLAATELVAYPVAGGIALRWRDPQASETGFRIEWLQFSSWTMLTNVSPDATTFTDATVPTGATRSYRVIATSAGGDAPPSNVATATAFSNTALKTCRAPDTTHQRASSPSVAFDGTSWAMAWADQRNGRESDIFFQLLHPDGTPNGAPVQITNDDVASTNPTLVWNGSKYGLLWLDHLRAADGAPVAQLAFALLGPTGAKIRGDVRIGSANAGAPFPADDEIPLIWDGSGWGIFVAEGIGAISELVFYRLDEDGDVLVNGAQISANPFADWSIDAAWNGSEYGVAWATGAGRFARVQPNGSLIGPIKSTFGIGRVGTSIVPDGSGWAIASADIFGGLNVINLTRLGATGDIISGPTRISDDDAFMAQPNDTLPKLFPKPGGGYIVYMTAGFYQSLEQEVGRLEADASGQRVGSRITISPDDDRPSARPAVAFDGTNFLVAWNETRLGTGEIAGAIVSPSGAAGTVNDLTNGHTGALGSSWPTVLSFQNGFVSLWNESFPALNQIEARIHRSNGTIVDRRPLNAGNPARRPVAVSNGNEFAVAWTDRTTGGVHFDRFDQNGNSLMSGGVRIADALVERGVGLDFDGSEWGVAWIDPFEQLKFQRMGHDVPIGVPIRVDDANGGDNDADPQVQWIGSGWAIVWGRDDYLWYARLDPSGAVIVPATRITDIQADQIDFRLVWTGQHLGLAVSENISPAPSPGIDILFTTLDANGFKQFTPVAAASTAHTDRDPAMYFDGTNFRIVHPGAANGIREIEVTPQGSVVANRFLGNHGEGPVAVAHNGATTALAWEHRGDLLFQTTECLADETPPSCPPLNGTFANGAVQLNWNASNDPESGILAYHLYRDGKLLTELQPTTFAYSDGGFTPAASHAYELRPYNGAYREANGCTPVTVTAGILVMPATLPNARANAGYNQTITASQGTSPYSFAVTNGTLPPGLTLNPNGSLSGTPTVIGEFQFTVTATDAASATGARTYLLRVCFPSFLSPTVLPDPVLNAPYQQTLTVQSGSGGPYTFSVTTGALPPGLTLAANGTLSGAATAAGAYNFTIAATENTSCATTQSYSLNVITGLAPTDIRAEAQSNSSILVRWTRPQRGETGFRVERSFDGGNSWGSINIVGADVVSHLDQGLSAATLAHYRIVALYGASSATSTMAAAMTFPLGPTKICAQNIGPYHPRAQHLSVAHNGTRWGVAWSDRRDGRLEDIYFSLLANDTGFIATALPVQVTNTDMMTRFPTLRWNGTHFGLLYSEQLRGPDAAPTSTTNFALLDSQGNLLRTGARIAGGPPVGFINNTLDLPLVWDGGGWGVFSLQANPNAPTDLYYRRLTPNGDVATGPVPLTSTPHFEFDVTAAWNGSEYGVAWMTVEGTVYKLWFARMQANGTLIGAPQLLDQTAPNEFLYATNLVWNAGEWALAWNFEGEDDAIVRFRLLNPDGSPKTPTTRLSDDLDPDDPPLDFYPSVMPKSGGGYFVFIAARSILVSLLDLARLEADAGGNRVGSRVYLTSTADGIGTIVPHAATDGTRFLIALEMSAPSGIEPASVVADATGNVVSGPTPLAIGHTGGSSAGPPAMVAMGANFGAIWTESSFMGGNQLYAKFYDGGGSLVQTRFPLTSSTQIVNRIAATAAGHSFALAWRDGGDGNVHFRRFDNVGNPLIADQIVGPGSQPGVAWNGEDFGVAFFSGGLRFQRVSANGTLLGPAVFIGFGGANPSPLVQWVDRGWAVVWRSGPDLFFALLDRNGAFLVPPQQVTFTPTVENLPQIAWSGDRLGLVWREFRGSDPPGEDLWFTALKLDGTKAFNEFAIVSSAYTDNNAAIYWDRDRFRIVYSDGAGGTRELAVQSDGTVLPGQRLYHNRNAATGIAFNGTSLGMLFNSLFDLTIQTSSCFDDVSAPACPNMNASFDGQKVRLTWPAVSDGESGIAGYNVHRDGIQLAELHANTTLFDDFGFISGTSHVYEVRAVNRAGLASSGCTTRTVVAGVSVHPATLPNSSVGAPFNHTLTGSGGTPPYTFAVTAGVLPPNISLDAGSGALSGTLSAAGLFDFTITATDALSQSGSRAYTVRVCSGITLFPTVLADGYLGNAYSQTVVAAGAVGNVTAVLSAGALPPGVALDPTGWINGTPTTPGTFNFTVAATDSIGCSTSRTYTILIGTGSAARHLSAFALGTSSIRLRWTDPQRNETGFRIERSLNLGASWTPITIVGSNTTTHTDGSLTAATTYSYRIIATTPSGDAPPSNAGTASTWPATAAKACIQQVSPHHAFARPSSVTRAGSQWAMAYQDRKNDENDEIWFTFLDANGAMTGTPLRITNNDSVSLRPVIQWNGTNIGIMWTEQLRGPNGELHSPYRFALLDAAGAVIRKDVRIAIPDGASSVNSEPQFLWDGSAWGFVEPHALGGNETELLFYRFDEDGDLLAGPINLTNHAEADFAHAVAWNGSEYGIAWIRGETEAQTIQFQRFSSAGVPLGSPVTVNSDTLASVADVVASPTGWAVTWAETPDGEESLVMLRRFDATGAPLGPATRLSDDSGGPEILDFVYEALVLPSGEHAVLTRSLTTNSTEVGLLRADAAGNRIGSRVLVSPVDAFVSGAGHFAFDGTNFAVTFNESRLGTQELASVIVTPSGGIVAGPTDLTSGHSPGNVLNIITTSNHQIAPLGGGFVTAWNEVIPGNTPQLYAKLFDGTGAVSATKFPLTTRMIRSRAGVVGVGSTFAVAFRDGTNAIAFCRYDASGNPLMAETTPVTGVNAPFVLVGHDGENYALAWIQGTRINFQRVAPDGTAIGPRAILAPQLASNAPLQMAWTGAGWAFVYAADGDVHYMLLDSAGAVVVAPVRVSFTPDENKPFLSIAWNGDVLGIAYTSTTATAPGNVVRFTVVGSDGIKQFSEVTTAEGTFGTNLQGLVWAGDRFRVVYTPAELGTMREVDFNTAGSQLGAARTISNRGGAAAVAWNGATEGVLWATLAELFFETTACLADGTPPPCPAVHATRTAAGVTLTWPAVADAESGIHRYLVYRDGKIIGETSVTGYEDASVRPSDEHSYRVTAVNGAFGESPGCALFTLIGSPGGVGASATSALEVQITWQIVAGATEYQVERSSDGVAFTPIGTAVTNAHSDTTVQAQTSYLYRVLAKTPQQISAPGPVDLATTVIFTDDPLVAQVTAVKAVHQTELREAIDAVRALAQLGAATYTNSGAAGTPIHTVDVQELRTALDQARTALALAPVVYGETIVAGMPVKAAHLQEVRSGVK